MKFVLSLIYKRTASFRKFAIRRISLKLAIFSFFIAANLFLTSQKAIAQTPINDFNSFMSTTTAIADFDIILNNDILFSAGGFNILAGAINGNGKTLNGNGNAGFKIQGNGAEKNVSFAGDITFNNFFNSVGNSGTAAQCGGLFVAGSAQNAGSGAAIVAFLETTVNFTSNSATSGTQGTAAQGGGLFAGGAVSAGISGSGSNISSGGTTTITFTSSTVNFTSNSVNSGMTGTAAQGGGLFAGGAVSAGAYNNGTNISSGGATTITFTSSTVNFTSNSVVPNANTLGNGTAAQGGGLFAGGAVSAGAYNNGSNISSGGTTTIIFTGSAVNFTSNNAISSFNTLGNGAAAQGGGLFAGGAVSAGAYSGGMNISSAATTTIIFTSSTIDFTSNGAAAGTNGTVAQGGGLFAGGAVSVGAYGNNSSGTTIITFTSSTVNFTSNSATTGNGGSAAQGGGLFAGGAVSVGGDNINNIGSIINVSAGGATTITFAGSTINFTGNSAISGIQGAIAQGGGLFAGGAVSAGASSNSTNISSAAITIITFTSSTVNFTGNRAASSYNGTAAQGGGLFAGGAVSAGASLGGNSSGDGAVTITFTSSTVNFTSNSAISGTQSVAQGGGLFAGGAVSVGAYVNGTNNSGGGTATITFTSSTVNFINNNAISSVTAAVNGGAAQGGGLFAGGAVSAVSEDMNISSGGTTTITFTSSTVNFINNSAISNNGGTAAQGGGLFAGGAISVGVSYTNAVNISSGGTTTITFTSSTVNFTSNSATSDIQGTAAQGGGLFAGGAVSAGEYYSANVSSNGATAITFTSSTVNFTSNSATSGIEGTAAQGGGLFAGGAVSAGTYIGTNISSGGAATITFTSSTVNIDGNQVTSGSGDTKAQGGGIFLGGSVSAGTYGGGRNISADGTAIIDFTGSNISISGNTAGLGGGIFEAGSVATDSGTASNGNAELNFVNSTVNFTGNIAVSSGGAIYIAGNFSADSALGTDGTAIINFTSSTVSFTSNTALAGGAIYAVNNSSITFDKNTTVEFLWNSSTAGDGVVQWDTTTYMGLQNANITRAIGNTADNGGFLYLDNKGTWNFGDIEMSSNTAGIGSGGALYLNNTNVNFNGSAVFSGNSSLYGGGTIYSYGATVNFNDSAVFTGNQSGTGGGAIYNNFANLNFTGSPVSFTNNIASGTIGSGGGAIDNTSNISFAASTVTFIGNMATGDGGAIDNNLNGNINFNGGAAAFIGNTAAGGGAIYNYSSRETFANTNVTFGSNTAVSDNGGAIYNYVAGNMSFTGSTVTFIGNTSLTSNGGAIYNANSTVNTFTGSNVIFDGNSAVYFGGAIFNAYNSNVLFSGSTVTFSNNTAQQGGAIYESNNSTVTFTNTNVEFLWNNSTNGNGVVAWDVTSHIVLNNSNITRAIGNTANNGGFLYLENQGTWNFSDVNMSSNTAAIGSGGALYLDATNVNFNDASVFSGNSSAVDGGALYMTGNTVSFNTDGGQVLFTGNTAGSVPNDVYMDINSQLNISGANSIRFEDGIVTSTTATGIAINKSGTGAMCIGGNSRVWGDLNITDGDIVMLESATYTGKALDLGSASALDMHNGTVNTVNVAESFTSTKNLQMDIFSNGTNDQITASSATIGGNLDIFAGVGTYNAKEYYLIITSGTDNLIDEFASSTISNNSLQYSLIYDSGTVKLTVTGQSLTNFGELKPLTYNQSETSKAFNKISANPGNWATILNEMAARQDSGTDADITVIKDFLARTSGYFLSNVIRNMAADSPNNEVYDKIRNHADEQKTNSGLWVQLRGGLESFKKDENSLEDYNDTSYGVMFGFDRFLADKLWNGDLMWGIYGRFNKDNIEQGNSKADGSKSGLGLYGGYLKDTWELKAMLLGEYDAVSTERADYVGDIAKADINGITVSADLEAALKIWMNDNMIFRPYAGIEAANTSYGGFNESGGGMYDLNTESGNYLRTAGRVGVGLDYEKGIWIWYANVEGKYIIDGTKPEITSEFADTGIDFNSRGAEEGKIQIGVGAGGEVRIAESWKLFANAKYYAAERYENLYGNIGVRYLFGKKRSKKEKEVTEVCRRDAKEAERMAGESLGILDEAFKKIGEAKEKERAMNEIDEDKVKEREKMYEMKIQAAKEAMDKADDGVRKADEAIKRAGEAKNKADMVKIYAARVSEEGYKIGSKDEKDSINMSLDRAISEADSVKENALQAKEEAKALLSRVGTERTKNEESKREIDESKIKTEISDTDLEKQKAEAEERRKRPMLKTYNLTTNFRTNSYFLTDEFKEQIGSIAQELKNYDFKRITIEGHTDSTGTKEINKRLSRQRARSVYDEFIKAGISSEKMTYEGFADTMPVKSNKTAAGRAANRRTEIFVE